MAVFLQWTDRKSVNVRAHKSSQGGQLLHTFMLYRSYWMPHSLLWDPVKSLNHLIKHSITTINGSLKGGDALITGLMQK